ncbi:hypothetical protein Acr_20g0000230 [Actinidia rufa]|uniref:Uncharacterized protein n=1 Tax=Actinidia rufa TaxID=165716 RepID=A0A7J0GBM2_9ERIC|nr:hypothetical protein Acr_20g0000230 [Actinidia rufa]
MLEGRPAQKNRSKGRGEAAQNPLRRGDQTKAMIVGFWWRYGDSKYSTRPRARRRQHFNLDHLMSTLMVALASSVEIAWRGSMDSFYLGQEGSEINNLRKEIMGDQFLMVLGRRACLSGEFYPTSVALNSKGRGGLRNLRLLLSHLFPPRPTRDRPASSTLSKYSSPDLQLSFSQLLSHYSDVTGSGDLDSLPSWVSDHLGEGSPYMTDEVNQSPSSPMEGSPEESTLVAVHPSVEEKTNIMTLEELDALRDTYSFSSGVQIRLPDEGETITSTRPGELIPNAWRSIACSMALWRVYKYSISLYEFRNLFSLNCNPKPDQGWLYFKARNKKVILGGYPCNVKGWKNKFFFVSSDEWKILRERLGWCPKNKHCNNPPQLYGDEPKIFEEIFRSVEESGRFSVPVLLDSKSFRRVFVSPGSRRRTAGDNLSSKEAPSSSSDVGESQNPHEQARRESPSRDDSIECLGSFRTELRRLLPHIPDLTLLRWTGGKVLDPTLDRFLNAPSSNPSSESCSDSSLPVELKSDAMSKRVSFKKIGEKLGKSAGASSGTPVSAKGVVIGEKRAGESITSSPNKRGKADDGSKGKGVDIGLEGKKKATSSSKASAAPTVIPSPPGEGTLAHLSAVPGPTPFILGSPSVAEELLWGVIPPADKEKVDKLTLDQTATKLFHVIGQALVLGSSLAVRSREAGEQASVQEGRVASMETEVARLQKFTTDLEQQLAVSRAREQQANDELAKAKSDRDSLSDKFERSGVLVNELREALNKFKEFAVEEFKSSSEFMVAVEDSASKYFGEGFNFCKVQLRRHHPDLAIDLEGTVVDQDLLAEQDEADEENEKEKTGENEGSN